MAATCLISIWVKQVRLLWQDRRELHSPSTRTLPQVNARSACGSARPRPQSPRLALSPTTSQHPPTHTCKPVSPPAHARRVAFHRLSAPRTLRRPYHIRLLVFAQSAKPTNPEACVSAPPYCIGHARVAPWPVPARRSPTPAITWRYFLDGEIARCSSICLGARSLQTKRAGGEPSSRLPTLPGSAAVAADAGAWEGVSSRPCSTHPTLAGDMCALSCAHVGSG